MTLSAGNDLSVNEGTTHTYSFTTTDPGHDTFVLGATELRRRRHPGRRDTFNTATGAGSFVCSFPDGPASANSVGDRQRQRRRLRLRHPDVTVNNVKPSIVLDR